MRYGNIKDTADLRKVRSDVLNANVVLSELVHHPRRICVLAARK